MCGFVGIINKCKTEQHIYKDVIDKMLKYVAHRGPDEQNTFIKHDSGVYLGFARLSMVDIAKSSQPFFDQMNNYVIMFNGEIYNYIELKKILCKRGCLFKTDGEVEVILKMYMLFGDDFVEKLDGMFSICIINLKNQCVFLARDRFGIKPLYYYANKDIIVISSELKAIRSWINLEIDYKAIELYFNFRFIPAPYTIYKNVSKLKAGEYIYIHNDQVKHTQFYTYNRQYKQSKFSGAILEQTLRDDILSTYESSEVPVGLFLSGGIDSGIIALYTKRYLLNNRYAFSIDYGYTSAKSNELQVINKLSRELNIQVEKTILRNSILEHLNNVVYFLDEPFYSTVSISTYCLSQRASQKVKGVLTGDGSDELIYGYNYIRKALSSNNVYDSYMEGIGWLKNIEHSEILGQHSLTKDDLNQIFFADCEISNNINETLRRVELHKRLPDYHMMRVDKLTMSSGLEARLPYLRNNYTNYILGIQSQQLIHKQDPKNILKKSLEKCLPKVLASTIKKPFYAPIKYWIENDLNFDINKVFSNIILINRLQLNEKRVNKLLCEYNGDYASVSNIWGVYLLLKWCELETSNIIK